MLNSSLFAPFASYADEAPAYWFLDCLWIVHATAKQTGGQYSIIEQLMPEGSGPPPHVHPTEEVFFVIEGEMTVHIGQGSEEKVLVIGAGCSGNVSRDTVHWFRTTKGPCRVLNLYSPAGFEQVLIGTAKPALTRTLPPKGFDTATHEEMLRFLNNYWSSQSVVSWATTKSTV